VRRIDSRSRLHLRTGHPIRTSGNTAGSDQGDTYAPIYGQLRRQFQLGHGFTLHKNLRLPLFYSRIRIEASPNTRGGVCSLFFSSKPTTTRRMACSVTGAAPHRMLHHQASMTVSPPEPEPSDYDWIGEGGFARVSKVRYRRTGEVFALKEAFYPSPDAYEEAEVLRRAAGYASPYVVRCHSVFLDHDGGQSSVLELMDAGSLFSVLCRRGDRGFPEPALADAAARCLMGLAQLHSRGIAHLDVKSENFLANAEGEVKISDFNFARIVYGGAGERLMVPTTTGTVPYYSPERFERNAHADPRAAMAADVWGLGVTVLELFLGRLPTVPEAEQPTEEDWKMAICSSEPPSVPEDMEASLELRDFVSACLQKDPTRRARVPQLLRHPFVTRRNVAASSRALRELIVENL
jgi:mitogen-activated protein kinase kinase 9